MITYWNVVAVAVENATDPHKGVFFGGTSRIFFFLKKKGRVEEGNRGSGRDRDRDDQLHVAFAQTGVVPGLNVER
jgi:hypothetical protein